MDGPSRGSWGHALTVLHEHQSATDLRALAAELFAIGEAIDAHKRAIAINLVIAWRIMLMTLLGRQCPDLPAEVLFSDPEIEVLQAYAKKKHRQADSAR